MSRKHGTHQVMTYAGDVNLIGVDIGAIQRNTEVLLNACKGIGLAVNTGKTKYMEIGSYLGMVANEHVRICSNSYEKVKAFKYLGSLVKNKISIHEEIKYRFKAGNSGCY